MSTYKLRITGASQIVTVCNSGERVLAGKAMKNITVLNADGGRTLGVVVAKDGTVAAVGYDDIIDSLAPGATFDEVIEATGQTVLPGLVDAHTHPVWSGDRVHEFSMKLEGATYLDIHAKGGGIQHTVKCVRESSQEDLYELLKARLEGMTTMGTTLVEAKSGYGLDLENEVKMLRAIEEARKNLPIFISSTYCGAHSVPKGSTMEEATQNVIQVQIPAIKELCDSGELIVDSIDVFCEKGVFDVGATRKILQAGKAAGMSANFHGDELNAMNAAELGAELGARCVSHLEEISNQGITAMSNSGVIGVLLPTTAYILRLKPPPARKMIDEGIAVALGSDFNPNAYCMSMPMVMHLACVLLHMTLEEALAAATINAAAALGKADKHGSLEVGKHGNMVLIDADRWEHLVYQFGCHNQLISHVIVCGGIVYQRPIHKGTKESDR